MITLLFLLLVGVVSWWLTRERSLARAIDELRWRQARTEADLATLRHNLQAKSDTPEQPADVRPPVAATTASPPVVVVPPPPTRTPPPLPPVPAANHESAPSRPAIPSVPSQPSLRPPPSPVVAPEPAFNWEQFVGVKLVAWLAGLALFLAAAFGLKYSFEQNLIPPAVRAGAGFVLGAGLLVAGVVLRRREYAVTAQTLAATGVVILYAVTFACRSLFHFEAFGPGLTFAVMTLVTAVAFGLAVRMDAQVVAVLGMLGGFLTPVLVSTGENNPVGLFGYLAILDLGLLAVAWRKRWDYLSLAAALGTAAMQFGWFLKFYSPDQVGVLQVVLPGFIAVFGAAFALSVKRDWANPFLTFAAALLPMVTLGVGFELVTARELAALPGRVFWIIFAADVALLSMVFFKPSLRALESVGGGVLFLLLGIWNAFQLDSPRLPWALGLTVGFALLHTAFPLALRRLRPAELAPASVWAQFFPALALMLVLIPLLKSLPVGPLFWVTIVLVDGLAIVLALLSGALLGLIAVVVLTFALAGVWLNFGVHEIADTAESLLVIGGFGVFLAAAGAFVSRRLGLKSATSEGDPRLRAAAPVLSATLPFLLLILLGQRLHPANPSAIFAVAAGLGAVLLALVRWTGFTSLLLAGLGAVGLLQWSWLASSFRPADGVTVPLLWLVLFAGMFTGFPFLFQSRLQGRRIPWAVSALAGVVHFPLAYSLVKQALPSVPLGLVPAIFALPPFAALAWLARSLPKESSPRLAHLAWFGGVGFLFVTLIFPVQFERQWITLGWAFEGVALCWLFHRLPHPGLRATGVGLLVAAFVRLALNPAVLSYHPPSGTPILNWYLYAYGLVSGALFAGAYLLAPPRERVFGSNVQPVLYTLGTILAFLLVNVEIADYFATGTTLTFEFSGNFARDLAYTIAWALFALGLIVVGVAKRVRSVRYAGLGLLGVVVLKLFLHDLANLNQLYRIIAFAGVAVIALAASVLYQRFLAGSDAKPSGD
jgi:uncharacterized membrane protein